MNSISTQMLEEPCPDLFVIQNLLSIDTRGSFRKIYRTDDLSAHGIEFHPAESFVTQSHAGVLRGMHFQVGRAAHKKLVTCLRGSILDVVVDVRQDSSNYNKPFSIYLSEEDNVSLLIGKGYAHGFLSLTDDSFVSYTTTTPHSPLNDMGILWNSIDFDWPTRNPTVSRRDEHLPPIISQSYRTADF